MKRRFSILIRTRTHQTTTVTIFQIKENAARRACGEKRHYGRHRDGTNVAGDEL